MRNEPWSVLHVVANHEKQVARQLTVRSLENYLPLYAERSRWSDRLVTLQRPLFPGYVFVRLDTQDRLSAITTPGVLKVLGATRNDKVDQVEIERIRQGLANGYVLRPHPEIRTGTVVRICRGIFEGAQGVVLQLRRRCTVVIALSGAGQCFSVETDLNDVEVLKAAS